MKIRQSLALGAAFAVFCTLPTVGLADTTISGRSSTVLDWSDISDRYNTGVDGSELIGYEYLLLNVRDIGDEGFNFKTYGRFAYDFDEHKEDNSRVYYAYLEKNNFVDNLDFRLGRQFISTIAGASIIDGLLLKYRNIGPANISFFGGGDVHFEEGYDFKKDLFYGTELSFRSPDKYALVLSYVQKNEAIDGTDENDTGDHSTVSNQLAGLEAYYNKKDLVNFYADLQYNLSTEATSYFLGGMKYYRSTVWSLRTEYLYSLPVFSDTSIYSVFAVDEYQEVSGQIDFKIMPGVKSFLRYSKELYVDFDDADVVELGVEKIRTERISGYLSAVYREAGDGQDLSGFKARVSYFFNRTLQAGLGVHYDVFERQANDADLDEETTSSRTWLYATAKVNKKINVQAKIERVDTDTWDEYYRGRVRLNVRF
jgi:hypothetical protein